MAAECVFAQLHAPRNPPLRHRGKTTTAGESYYRVGLVMMAWCYHRPSWNLMRFQYLATLKGASWIAQLTSKEIIPRQSKPMAIPLISRFVFVAVPSSMPLQLCPERVHIHWERVDDFFRLK